MTVPSITATKPIVIAVDVMGADLGVREILRGLVLALENNPNIFFRLYGRETEISNAKKKLKALHRCCEIIHCDDVVTMDDKPSQVMRRGKNTSMYAAIEAVKTGEAQAAVSCGNTGALMALSMLILRKLPGVNRPAIAVLWPSASKTGVNIMLDGGADIKADAKDLLQYAAMGASYARNGFGIERPRIGLLNVGTEDHKGRTELQEANELISSKANDLDIEFRGFIEGGDITSDHADVIITDGFTGNVALKTGEGVAKFITGHLREAFRHSLLSRLGALFAMSSLNRLRKRLDPRQFNGGVFMGLNGTIIKSHGSSDAVAFSTAVQLAITLAENDFHIKVTKRLNSILIGD